MIKKFFFTLLLAVNLFIFSGCEDNLNPNGEYRESYALNCVLNCDNSIQYLTLTQTYLPASPDSAKIAPYIQNADIKIYYRDEYIQFYDTTVTVTDSNGTSLTYNYYYAKNFKPTLNTVYDIDVLLPNGRRLRSQTETPNTVEFQKLTSDLLITLINKELLSYFWKVNGNNIVYVPKLTFVYYKKVNGITTKHTKQIPIRYENINGNETPIYPKPDKHPYVFYDINVVKKAFEEISEGDPYKGNYSIVSGSVFEVIVLDRHLSAYYSSANAVYGEFSVKLDESDYTNISNGFGIFASYLRQDIRVNYAEEFVNSFGYALVFN